MAGDWNGQVPDHAELQVQHGMSVTGATHAYVAGLVGGNRLIVQRIERDDSLIDLINATEAAFWEHVLNDTEPPVDDSAATRAALIHRYPIEDRPVEVPLTVGAAIQADWHAGHAQEKAGKAKKKAAENQARALLAGGNRLVTEGHVWARIKGGVFAPKKFESEMPDVADLYRKKVEVIDLDAIKAEQPAVFRKFQAQVFEALK
jgi:predicted phage-related endonuclease